MRKLIMKIFVTCVFSISFVLMGTVVGLSKIPALKIGTFDSRALALAYWRSDEGMKELQGLHEEMRKAKQAGDEKRIKELEIEGPGKQVRLHQQVFSTGTVTDVVKKIQTELPLVAKEAGVSLIVSKWQIAYKDTSIEYVDVTLPLVKLFNPDEKIMKMVEQIMKTDPVPIEELSMDPNSD